MNPHSDIQPPNRMSDTLFSDICEIFAQNAEREIEQMFDSGVIDQEDLPGTVTTRLQRIEFWLYAAEWFSEEYDNDLLQNEYVTTTVDEEPFEGANWYRSTFIQILLADNRSEPVHSQWRQTGSGRDYVVYLQTDDE